MAALFTSILTVSIHYNGKHSHENSGLGQLCNFGWATGALWGLIS